MTVSQTPACAVEPRDSIPPADRAPVIRIAGLRKSFDDKEVICGIDLQVHPGRILGYLGPNGAGKSTTVKILIGMIDEFEGEVSVCGYDVRRDPLEVKRRIGYVPESAALYEVLTPLEFLTFVGRLHGMPDTVIGERSMELLRLFGLADEAPNRMSTFSKGMKQKVMIVAGLIHNPQVVFLDEPLSGLDANAMIVIKELIKALAQAGATVFYCSHIMDVVERVCDRIIIIDRGKIVADGSFHELQALNKEASLERIFTQLTGTGGQEEVAKQFMDIIRRPS